MTDTKPSPEQIIDDVWIDAEDAPGYDVRKALTDAGYVIVDREELEGVWHDIKGLKDDVEFGLMGVTQNVIAMIEASET